MSSTYKTLENNQVEITFTIPPDIFEESINHVYNIEKSKIHIQGFRKGKAPRKIIELHYGPSVFYVDAINHALPKAYDNAIEELDLTIVSEPTFDVEEVTKEKGAVLTATAHTKPEVEITKEDYTGVTYDKVLVQEVGEEEINKRLEDLREQNSRIITIEDRAVKYGDIILIDFEGFIDNVPFEGGKAENHRLTIGSKSFIDTFEDQLIGRELNEELEVNVRFPDAYHAEALQGKPAMFKVTINEITEKQIPDLDDEFAQDASEFDTLVEFKDHLREVIASDKTKQSEQERESKILRSLVEKIGFDVPESMVETQMNNIIDDFEQGLRRSGMSLEHYLHFSGQEAESFREQHREVATTQVRGRLILETIAKLEGYTVNEEEFDEELENLAKAFGIEKDKLLETMDKRFETGLRRDITVRKAMAFVRENAIELE
jgi:trigger factor